MIGNRVMITRCVAVALVGAAFLTVLSTAEAGYKATIGGIKVTYNRDGCFAYYNDIDETLTIEIWESGGTLNVKAGRDAWFWWGPYCDVYIDAGWAYVKNMNFKGRYECVLFVVGEVGGARSLKVKAGVVGYTYSYGPDFGLYSWSSPTTLPPTVEPPKKIIITDGYATASVLGPAQFMSRLTRGAKPDREDVFKSEALLEGKEALCEALRSMAADSEQEEGDDPDEEPGGDEPSKVEVTPGNPLAFWQMLLRTAKD